MSAGALAVAHLAQDPAAGAGDAFDGGERTVRIGGDVHRGNAAGIAILSGDLVVFCKFGDHFPAG